MIDMASLPSGLESRGKVLMANDKDREQIDELYDAIQGKIRCMPSSRCSIVKVPKKLRKVKEEAYIPEILSIGPLHRDRDSVKASTEITKDSLTASTEKINGSFKAMEQHKEWYLDAFLSRLTDSREVKLKEFINSMKRLERETRECYAEPIDLTSDQFVEMMLLDSCFILELLIRKRENDEMSRKFDSDPIFNTVWMMESLQRDLLLLENQLPFTVLEKLFDSIKDPEQGYSLAKLAVNFFDSVISSFGIAVPQHVTGEYKHFLGLLHCILVLDETLPDGAAANNQNSSTTCQHVLNLLCNYLLHRGRTCDETTPRPWEYIHCAMDLREAGVNFKEKMGAKSLMDIEFDKNGVLHIPHLKLADYTDPLLRNLLALEQCNDDYGSGVTSYAALLDSLISTQRDVRLLRRRDIIDCGLKDHDVAAIAFNKLGDGVMVRDFLLKEICHKVNAYFRTDWHRWRYILKREYFRNPWASVSIVVAFVITVLALTQTVFTVLSHYHR